MNKLDILRSINKEVKEAERDLELLKNTPMTPYGEIVILRNTINNLRLQWKRAVFSELNSYLAFAQDFGLPLPKQIYDVTHASFKDKKQAIRVQVQLFGNYSATILIPYDFLIDFDNYPEKLTKQLKEKRILRLQLRKRELENELQEISEELLEC